MKKTICLLFAICTLATPGASPNHHIFSVHVSVTAPETYRSLLISSVLNELRRRSDVAVVSENSEFELELVCIHNPYSDVISCSSTAGKHYDGLEMIVAISPSLKKSEFWPSIQKNAQTAVYPAGQWVTTVGSAKLDQLTAAVVADLDADVLEHERLLYAGFR